MDAEFQHDPREKQKRQTALQLCLAKALCTHPNCKVTSNTLPNVIRYFFRTTAFYFSLLLKFFELFYL